MNHLELYSDFKWSNGEAVSVNAKAGESSVLALRFIDIGQYNFVDGFGIGARTACSIIA